jgi:hypothetical protein
MSTSSVLPTLLSAVAVLRDAEVLSLFAAIINKLKGLIEAEVPRVFEAVFEVTLQVGWVQGRGGTESTSACTAALLCTHQRRMTATVVWF